MSTLEQERDTWKANCAEAIRQLAEEERRVKALEDALNAASIKLSSVLHMGVGNVPLYPGLVERVDRALAAKSSPPANPPRAD